MKKNKAQAALTYASLIAIVVGALVIMTAYVFRRVQGSYKRSADTFGQEEQFDANTVVE